MAQTQVNIDGYRLIITTNKSPLIVRLIFAFLLVVSFLIPLVAIYFAINYVDGLQFGLIITFLIFWGIGYYILRLFLWNTYGQEILTLNSENVSYVADFKFFKDGYQELDTKDLSAEVILDQNSSESKGHLKIQNKSSFIETVLKTKKADLDMLRHEIDKRYNKI
jgi:hypothetical protein